MPIVFVDSHAHYTTAAQGRTKYAQTQNAPAAATGAFAAPGVAGHLNFLGAQYNVPQTTDEREFALYLNIPALDLGSNLWSVWDNTFPQIFADVQPDGSIKIYAGTMAGGAFAAYGTRAALLGIVPAGRVHFGIQSIHKVSINHHASTGTLTYRIDGVTVLTLTGINTASSTNAWSTILYVGYVNLVPSTPGPSAAIRSHVVIADTIGDITGNPRTGALFPEGVGASSDWIPSSGDNWERVSETTPDDDSSTVSSDTVDDVDTYEMEDAPADVIDINAVAVTARLKKDDANSRLVAAVLRIGGVDYVHPTEQGIPGDYAFLQWIWDVSPATSVPFTLAEVNALEAGIKVVA